MAIKKSELYSSLMAKFVEIMDGVLPRWPQGREKLNPMPVRHVD